MNAAHIAVGSDLLIAAGSTALCSPFIGSSSIGRNRTNMRFWSIDHDDIFNNDEPKQGYAGSATCINEPTLIVIVSWAPNPSPYWALDSDETWCRVLIHGELRLFKLRLRDFIDGHIKIIDEKAS